MRWTPPERPEWARNLIAQGESLGDSALLGPLVADELVELTRSSTGLQNFEPDTDWMPHFEVLIRALSEESGLHFVGRLLNRTEILRSL